MKMVFFILIIFYSCSGKSTHNFIASGDCNIVKASELADDKMTKMNYKLESLSVSVSEDSIYYHIQYLPVDLKVLGGGAEFKINKDDCKVIDIIRYQ